MSLAGLEQPSKLRPTWVEIDLGALGRNFGRVRERVGSRRVWCVVKANAYGHGAVECARRLQEAGAEAFAVATVEEGVELREAGIGGRVVVLAGIEPVGTEAARAAAGLVVRHELDVAVWRPEAAAELGAAARQAGVQPVRVHLKTDTGMGRLGVTVDEDVAAVLETLRAIAAVEGVRPEGLFSNLAAADAPEGEHGHEHTGVLVERFARLCEALDEAGLLPPERHLSNSAALLRHDGAWRPDWCNGVRPGLSLYGVASFPGEVTIVLEPVMSWHSAIAAVRAVPAGWPLGYGAERRAAHDCEIAVVPVGYHDGFPRALSDRGEVLIGDRRARIVGAISMDLTLVDITGMPAAREGSAVTLLGVAPGGAGGAIDANELADRAGTIAHEILSRVGARVPRRFTDSGS